MINIVGERGTGKTRELLKVAEKYNGIVLTEDKRGLQVKAKNYGFNDLEIIDYTDLEQDNFSFGKSIIVHNGDKVLSYLLNKYYNLEMIGLSATIER